MCRQELGWNFNPDVFLFLFLRLISFICIVFTTLGLCCQGPSPVAASRLLLVAAPSSQSAGSICTGISNCTYGLGRCGTEHKLPCGMWDLSKPGIKPVSPTLADRFLTTGVTGKPQNMFLSKNNLLTIARACYLLEVPWASFWCSSSS